MNFYDLYPSHRHAIYCPECGSFADRMWTNEAATSPFGFKTCVWHCVNPDCGCDWETMHDENDNIIRTGRYYFG